ncbi:hypothetical protein EV363DRAFT_1203942 [Boletus edulis]|nr:hypothetical protein EV363DRAFT_1203942 [Boletus edulis]
MTVLHVYFTLRNQQAFQRLLERDRSVANPQSGQSASAGKSWTRKNIASALEVNAFDDLGRTVLHLACTSTDPASLEYARMLLAHPFINVNLPDKENHWTALHRALYAGNIEAAIMLLKRMDIDTSIKDMEGYTAFDLYNSTVRTANTTFLEDGYADLLTWGANRNAALGLGDSNDRTHPDHVVILKRGAPLPASHTLEERFRPVKVRSVGMSKLHTVILTDEPRDNVRFCGFGSGGRLGTYSHTLYTPTPFTLSSHFIVSVALGQDHTLALTSAGEVISWGLNRFAQLGYVIESGQGGSADEFIQTTPRKISHLKKEFVKGVAACKTASACWSDGDVWTWGTNNGQLGYSKTASPIQILPRKASIITQPIRGIAMSDTAMICLFMAGEVVCVWNGGVSKINFPAHAFPSDISMVYRPPQAIRAPAITKLVCCDDLFAALSSNGEVFTFSLPTATEAEGSAHVAGNRGLVKPQRAWALRRQFSSVRDVDIGGDGALIVCTQSGHVFVRSRNLKGSSMGNGTKAFKFQRVAHVQRAVAVCANSTGAFGALRVDYKPPPISVVGRHFSADMAAIVPYVDGTTASARQHTNVLLDVSIGPDDDLEDTSVLDDIGEVAKLMTVLHDQVNQVGLSAHSNDHGADVAVRIGTKFEIPAHRVILTARCMPLREVLGGDRVLCDKSSKISVAFTPQPVPPVLQFTGITPLSLLILLHYLYADEVLAIWDRRIGSPFEVQLSSLGLSGAQVKADLASLAQLLCLPHLTTALQFVGKRVAKPFAGNDFQWLFDQAQLLGSLRRDICKDPLAPDVALHFADKTVYTHSVVLRARSAFFSAFFSDPDWAVRRRDDTGVLDVEMGHYKWHVMQFVLSFVCFGQETMFETLDFLYNVDELLEFMFLVISAANELLLTRLVLLCSQIVLKYLNVYNACYLLTDAIHFNAVDLADRIQTYMAANLEMLLESRILDDLDPRVVRRLSEHARVEQAVQSPISRFNKLGRVALEKHKEWLALQDIPVPIIPSQKPWSAKDPRKMSPPSSAKKVTGRQSRLHSPTTSPVLRPSAGDEIFTMDDTDEGPSLRLNPGQASGGEETHVPAATVGSAATRLGWKKSPATPRTDLKAIMAEAEIRRRQVHTNNQGSNPSASVRLGVGSSPGIGKGTSTSQGVGSSRQPGPAPGQPWQPDTPPVRRVLPEPATPPKPESPTPSRTSTASRVTQATQASPGPSQPSMGPVITPVRQTPNMPGPASTGSCPRKPSLGSAWTLPPVQPIAAATIPSSTTTLSFAEIQKIQEIQATASTSRDKRSLRDIQEEERALQQEADFLKWWAQEEERVRLEMLEREQGQERGRTAANRQHKNKGGKARPRKSKAETQPNAAPSNVATQQQKSRGHQRPRQREGVSD